MVKSNQVQLNLRVARCKVALPSPNYTKGGEGGGQVVVVVVK